MPDRSAPNVDDVVVSKAHQRHLSAAPDVLVRNLIEQRLGIDADRVVDETTFRDDLGADSLDAFDLLMALEERFGIEIPDEAADSMSRAGDAVAYIDARVVSAHTRPTDGQAPNSLLKNPRS